MSKKSHRNEISDAWQRADDAGIDRPNPITCGNCGRGRRQIYSYGLGQLVCGPCYAVYAQEIETAHQMSIGRMPGARTTNALAWDPQTKQWVELIEYHKEGEFAWPEVPF